MARNYSYRQKPPLLIFERIEMDKIMIGYVWMLTLMGAVFLGNEIAMMTHNMDKEVANLKLQQCQRLVAGGMYE